MQHINHCSFFTYSFVVVTVDFIVQLNKEVTIMGLICDT